MHFKLYAIRSELSQHTTAQNLMEFQFILSFEPLRGLSLSIIS